MNQGNKAARKAPRLAGSEYKLDNTDLAYDADDEDDDNEDIAGSLMEVVCLHPGGQVVRFNIDGHRYKMREGEIIKIPAAYATPVQYRPQGDPLPSVIERETGRKVLPVNDPRVEKDSNGVPKAVAKAAARKAAQLKAAQSQGPGAP